MTTITVRERRNETRGSPLGLTVVSTIEKYGGPDQARPDQGPVGFKYLLIQTHVNECGENARNDD